MFRNRDLCGGKKKKKNKLLNLLQLKPGAFAFYLSKEIIKYKEK